MVSQTGDWFTYIGFASLLLTLTGSGEAVGWFLVARLLPRALLTPTAGAWVDRLPRRTVLIAVDLARAVSVLGYLLVDGPEDVWLIYAVTVVSVSAATFHEPARGALQPQVCAPDELVAAGALGGATWSAAAAGGAALGGLVSTLFGLDTAVLIDAGSFLLSAWLVAGVRLREGQEERAPRRRGRSADLLGLRDFAHGLAYMLEHPPILALALLKGGLLVSGANLTVLTVLGEQVFADEAARWAGAATGAGGLGVGLLFGVRGVGAGLGSLGVRAVLGDSPRRLRWAIAGGIFLHGFGYVLLGRSAGLAGALPAVLIAHAGGAVVWVYSSTLIQMAADNRVQGRIFAVETAWVAASLAAASLLAGRALDGPVPDPRELAVILGWIGATPALLWAAAQGVLGAKLDRMAERGAGLR